MEEQLWSSCLSSIDADTALPRRSLPTVRSLIMNPTTSDSTISSILETLTRSLQLTLTDPLLHHYTLKLLADLCSRRNQLAPVIFESVKSNSLLSANSPRLAVDALSVLVSISECDRSLRVELDDRVFLSLCFGPSVSARVWLLRNAEKFGVRPEVLVSVFLGFMKDPYPYVRKAALDGLVGLCKNGVFVDRSVMEACYCRAVELLRDDEDYIRAAAVRVASEWGRTLIANSEEKDERDWSDAVFLKLCSMVRDMSVVVRIEAFDALGMVKMVSKDILLQTLSNKVLRKLEEKGLESLASTAARAFVHGLEDEFFEVRKSACHSLYMLCITSTEFAGEAIEKLMDLLNDDSMVVRLEALEAFYYMATYDCLKVPKIHRHMFLGTLLDKNDQIRSAVRKIFKIVKLPELEFFRISINSLLEILEKYPQDEADVFSVFFHMGQRHCSFAARIIKEVSQEIEPVSEGKLGMDSARVAAFLVLAISVPFSHDQKVPSIPPRLFSYAVTFLSRISLALNDVMDQNTLLAYLCQCSRSYSSSGMEVGEKELIPIDKDEIPSPISIEVSGDLAATLPPQKRYRTSNIQLLTSCQSKDMVTSVVESELEEHDEVWKSLNGILVKLKHIWLLVQSRCINDALGTLRACKEELAMLSLSSFKYAGALAFMMQYLKVTKLLAKIWKHILMIQSYEMAELENLLGKLDRKLREMRCRFTGLSKVEELHILELVLVACVLRLSKVEICCCLSTFRKLSTTVSYIEFLHEEGSIELSSFIVEVKKTLNGIGESIVASSCPSLPFTKLVNWFSFKQLNLCGKIRQIHAELDVLDNNSVNPFPFVSGLPVGIRLGITLYNVSSEIRLWVTLKMNELSTQFVFLDMDLLGGCCEVNKFPFTAPFFGSPRVSSFTLRVCIGMECLFEEACTVKGYGGPKYELMQLCQEKEVYLRMV